MKASIVRSLSALAALIPIVVARGAPPDSPITIAFIGDQGLGASSRAVLQLISAQGADAVIHGGDFDYDDDPAAWDAQVDSILGPGFPYFGVIGNHDEDKFHGPGGYQARLRARMERLSFAWEGEVGVRCSFSFMGIFVVMTAPGIYDSNDPMFVDADYIDDQAAADRSIWRIASWHKNMRNMQVGDKPDETGWGVYEAARRRGAIIATGHEHSYSRTNLISDFEHQTVASIDHTLQLARDDPYTPGDEGRSFAFVSGLGGRSIRDQKRCMPAMPPYGCGNVWASIYTNDQDATHGVLFGTFNYNRDPRLAHFYFMDIQGQVIDEFFVRAAEPIACPADFNDDLEVDALDLIFMLNAWGQGGTPADLDGSGDVDILDMLVLLHQVGHCG